MRLIFGEKSKGTRIEPCGTPEMFLADVNQKTKH